ncbi:MAG TPA: hypothetical protein DCY61_00690, partial [Dehalococcoidia bacterium]|nr:hypothetical protein [Dehalococcoidia bacterium]
TGWKIDIKSASVAEEEMAVRAAEEIALVGEIEEPAVEIEEAEEEIVEAVLVKELQVPEGAHIRFAEDILPQVARERTVAEKSKKDLADAKPRGKKKARRVKPVPDEIEDEIDVEL